MKTKSFIFNSIIALFISLSIIGCEPGKDGKDKAKATNDSLLVKHKQDSLMASKKDLITQGFKGAVETVRMTSYKAVEKFGEVEKGKREKDVSDDLDYYKIFNEKGNIVERYEYRSDGSLDKKTIWKYNEKGIKTEADVSLNPKYYKGGGSPDAKNIFKCDVNGNVVEQSVYEVGGKLDGVLDGKNTFVFNEKDKMIEKNYYDAFESLVTKTKYKYDDKLNLVEENLYKSDGSLDKKTKYKYDVKGNKIEKNIYKSDGSLDKKTKYIYDNKGNIMEENTYSSNGDIDLKSVFEYDKEGNWIKITKYKGEKPAYIIEREFEYFVAKKLNS